MPAFGKLALRSAAPAAIILASSSVAFAQQVAETAAEEIIVTARKSEESIADVPVSITVQSGEFVESRGLRTVRDLQEFVPNFTARTDSSTRVFTSFRGIGGLSGNSPGVAMFIDGVFQPNQAFFSTPLLDVERIEFLRGPQGTLYGRNTLGGAISIVTRDPSNEFSGRVEAQAAEANALQLSGSVGGPIIADKLFFRLAAAHEETDGFIRNATTGGPASKRNTETVRATLLAKPVDTFSLRLSAYTTDQQTDANPYVPVNNPSEFNDSTLINQRAFNDFETYGASLTANWDIAAGHTLTTVTAYDRLAPSREFFDLDYSAATTLGLSTRRSSETVAQELRYMWEASETISLLTGLYYADDKFLERDRIVFFRGAPISSGTSRTKLENKAAFANLTVRPVPQLELVGGLRFDRNDISLSLLNNLAAVGPTNPRFLETDESVWQPKVSATYFWTDDFMTYASVARGYRQGGFNTAVNIPAPFASYDPERTWNYELGTKATLLDGRLTGGLTLFYVDDSNAQQLDIVLFGGTPTNLTRNTGDVKVKGIEVDFQARPIEGLTLGGGMSLNDFDVSGGSGLPLAEKRKFVLNARYDQPLSQGLDMFVSTDLSHFGPTFLAAPDDVQGTKTVLNAQIGLSIGDGIEVAAFVRNLTDEKYFLTYADRSSLGTPFDLGVPADRQQFGVRASFRFN